MTSKCRRAAIGTVLVCLIHTTLSQAQDVKGSGRVSYVPHASETFELPDGTAGQRLHLKGVVTANEPTNSIHFSTQDCFGTYLMNSDGTISSASGYCDGIDRDGHIWWIWWKGDQAGSSWGFLGGTGKYDGVEGGGTTKTELLSPDGRLVDSWEGSWKMK